MAKLSAAIAILILIVSSANAFSNRKSNGGRLQTRLMSTLPSPEESAKALTDYMAKSHEEKLRAVKVAEEKAASEIKSLQSEVEDLRKSRASSIVQSSAPAPVVEGSREDLAAKLVAYQKFMSAYIVKAQEQKAKAVKAAEEAAEKKFHQKLLLLGGSAPDPKAAASLSSQNQLYTDRNAKISAAAKAGRSRWGDEEIQKASHQGKAFGTVVNEPATAPFNAPVAPTIEVPVPPGSPVAPTIDAPVPPEVEAADHGLRADGGVDGLTLAQRVSLGADAINSGLAAPAAAAPTQPKSNILFNKRIAKVSAAAKAGKSRWGEMEIKKAIDLAKALPAASSAAPASVAPVTPEVAQAADHGLISDGSVDGPTLAERVNLGAQLLRNP